MNPGLSPAVQAAIGRRSGGSPVPQLQQVSPQAPMASGAVPQPMPTSAMDKKSTVPTTPKTTAQKYVPQNQSDMITSALVEQLKSNNQLEKQKLKVQQGASIQPATPQAPQMPMNQAPAQNMGQGVFGAPSSPASSPMNQQGNPFGQSPF